MADATREQRPGMRRVLAKIAARIENRGFYADAEIGRIDFIRSQQGAVPHRPRDELVGACRRKQIADPKILARHTNTQRNKPVCAGPGELCRQKQFASWVAPFGQPCPAPVLEALSVARSCQGLFVERTPFRKKQSGNDSSSMFSAAACANCVRQSIKDTANINHPALAIVHAYA